MRQRPRPGYGLSGAEGVPLAWLEGSPFIDYFIPSLVLFVVVGDAFLVSAIAVFTRLRFARMSALGTIVIVVGWLAVQVPIIGYVSWMQPATALVSLVIFVLAWMLPTSGEAVRRSHARPDRRGRL